MSFVDRFEAGAPAGAPVAEPGGTSSAAPAALLEGQTASRPEQPSGGVLTPVVHYRGAFLRLLRSEIRLMFRRKRNLALLVALGALPILIGVAVKASSPHGDGPPFLLNITGNGLFLVFTSLVVSMPLFLPLVIGVVAGDSVAGEAGTGTLRYLLTIPVGRGRLLTAKGLALLIFAAVEVAIVVVVGVVTGWALFGLHNLTLLSGDTVSLGNGLLRTAAVGVYVVASLTGLLALGLFVSTLTEVPIAAMAAIIALTIASQVLDTVPQLSSIHGLLLTHHWLDFGDLLRSNVDVGTLVSHCGLQLAYIAIFGSLAWARFTTKDVTS